MPSIHCARHFPYMWSHLILVKSLLSLLFRWGNQGSEKWNILPKAKELGGNKAETASRLSDSKRPVPSLMSHCHHSNPEVLHPPRVQATLVFCLDQDFSLILQKKLTRVIDCSKDSHKTSWCGIVTCIATELFSRVLSYSLWHPLVWKNCQHHFVDGENQSSQLLKSWFLTLRKTKS